VRFEAGGEEGGAVRVVVGWEEGATVRVVVGWEEGATVSIRTLAHYVDRVTWKHSWKHTEPSVERC
jgi:hypothetical protein